MKAGCMLGLADWYRRTRCGQGAACPAPSRRCGTTCAALPLVPGAEQRCSLDGLSDLCDIAR